MLHTAGRLRFGMSPRRVRRDRRRLFALRLQAWMRECCRSGRPIGWCDLRGRQCSPCLQRAPAMRAPRICLTGAGNARRHVCVYTQTRRGRARRSSLSCKRVERVTGWGTAAGFSSRSSRAVAGGARAMHRRARLRRWLAGWTDRVPRRCLGASTRRCAALVRATRRCS